MAGAQPTKVQEIQAIWLREWHKYMVSTYAPECIDALEVGCGAGFVLRNLQDILRVKGIDLDKGQISLARDIGMNAEVGDAAKLEFAVSSIDLVYCSFFLMWVDDPGQVLDEMVRLAKRKVMILSEPIWSRTVLSPPELGELVDKEIRSIEEQGGNPDLGLSLVKLLKERDLNFRFGTVPMDTSTRETKKWVDVEMEYVYGQGGKVGSIEPELFHVPFIWAVIDLS